MRYKGNSKSPFLIIFILLSVISGTFFNDIYLDNSAIVQLCYPFITPFFLLLGPSLWLHYKDSSRNTQLAIFHFLPSFILFLDHISFTLINEAAYQLSVLKAIEGNFYNLQVSWFFSGTFELLIYPIVTCGYAIAIIIDILLYRKFRKDALLLLCITIVSLTPFLLNVINSYLNKEVLIKVVSLDASRILLGLVLVPLYAHSYLYHTDTSKNRIVGFFDDKLSALDPIKLVVETEKTNPESQLLQSGISKDAFIKAFPYPPDLWELYFKNNATTFTHVKKMVRIAHAQRLINDGFLTTYSVEALCSAIGYQSRTSFYQAFNEVTGIKFKDYRETI